MTKMLEPEQVAGAWALWDMQHTPQDVYPVADGIPPDVIQRAMDLELEHRSPQRTIPGHYTGATRKLL